MRLILSLAIEWLGTLIDLGHGDDWYSDPRIKQGETVVKSHVGIAYDDGVPEKK